MDNKFLVSDKIDAQLIKTAQMVSECFTITSHWFWEHWRKYGGKNYSLIDTWNERNVVTDEGLNSLLGVYFSDDTQITDWYLLCFEDDYTPLITNTYATPGFTETTAYDETTRPAWQEGGASAKAISNSANKASFTFNATKSIYGGALVGGGTGANTKGDTAGGGVMFCSSRFTSGTKSVVNTDILKVSVALSCADA